jgi:hypothetical protein
MDAKRDERMTSLVKTYEAMKPKDAANIFNGMEDGILLDIAKSMKPATLAAIMSTMTPKRAEALTRMLAGLAKPPAKHRSPAENASVSLLRPPAGWAIRLSMMGSGGCFHCLQPAFADRPVQFSFKEAPRLRTHHRQMGRWRRNRAKDHRAGLNQVLILTFPRRSRSISTS